MATAREARNGRATEQTLVGLDDQGRLAEVEYVSTLPEVAAAAGRIAGEATFLLGVDIPVVVPAKASRARPVEGLVRRRFGVRLPPGGRAAADAQGVAGEALIAGLAAAGRPCLPYPDRNKRQNGLAECHAPLILKALLWDRTAIAESRDPHRREELFRAYSAPGYRGDGLPARAGWADQAVAIELVLRSLGSVAGYDLAPVTEALAQADGLHETDRAAGLLDALLIAGTALRYLEAPESSLFLGNQETGYTILPADAFIRRLGSTETAPAHGALFPQGSLRQRLSADAKVRSMDLLSVPGRPQRLEATFTESPNYEFDNLDEMLWWKHCRHLSGPRLPTEGLAELHVVLADHDERESQLRLIRSRHRTLSFRFDPPGHWRMYVPTRDGKTYPLRVLRAVYETLPAG